LTELELLLVEADDFAGLPEVAAITGVPPAIKTSMNSVTALKMFLCVRMPANSIPLLL
jgi:hypothetical protein